MPDPLDPGGKTVLHNTAIVVMAECLPVSHSSDSVPTFVLGNAGGLMRAGTLITKTGITNKTVLATVLQVFGAPAATQFGSTDPGGAAGMRERLAIGSSARWPGWRVATDDPRRRAGRRSDGPGGRRTAGNGNGERERQHARATRAAAAAAGGAGDPVRRTARRNRATACCAG